MDADQYNQLKLTRGILGGEELSALTRIAQERLGLTVDGKLGPATIAALEDFDEGHGEPDDQLEVAIGRPPIEGLIVIPKSRREIVQLAGDPGPVAKPRKKWRKANIVSLRDYPGVSKWVDVHRLVEPYLREALRRCQALSTYKIERCGGFVHRHIRRDPARPLSLHSYGWAVDINYPQNKARTFKRGECPVPWSDEWMEIWPDGVPREFVEAMESAGWTWGGVWGRRGGDFAERAERCSFADNMHFELRDR